MVSFVLFEFHRYSRGTIGVTLCEIMLSNREGALLHIERRYDGRWFFEALWLSMLKSDA